MSYCTRCHQTIADNEAAHVHGLTVLLCANCEREQQISHAADELATLMQDMTKRYPSDIIAQALFALMARGAQAS